MRLKTHLFTFIIAIVSSLVSIHSSAENTIWKQVPLRSENQRLMGFSGGEGMQLIWGLSEAIPLP